MSLAVGADGQPRVAYLDAGGAAHLATADHDGSILYHEPISATGWRTSFLVLYGNAPGNVSLALDAQDQPHLAWEQYIETDSIWYAR